MAVKQLSDGNPDGTTLGQSASDLVAFHGFTPIAQRTKSTISGSVSTGVAVAVCSTKWGFKSSTAITKLVNTVNEIKATLCAYGLHKGGA